MDTLLGRFLPSYTARPKRRVIQSPKFYFADVGVVNHLARRGELVPRSELFGKALENYVFHELTAYAAYHNRDLPIAYWRLASGIEVDFVVGDMVAAIEVKATAQAGAGTAEFAGAWEDHPTVGRRSRSPEPRRPGGRHRFSGRESSDVSGELL